MKNKKIFYRYDQEQEFLREISKRCYKVYKRMFGGTIAYYDDETGEYLGCESIMDGYYMVDKSEVEDEERT